MGADIVPTGGAAWVPSVNHEDGPRKETRGVFLHSSHGGTIQRAGESYDDYIDREYQALVRYCAGANTSQASPHFAVGSRAVTRLVHDDDIAWCQTTANPYWLSIELAKPTQAAKALKPFTDYQYRMAADLCARWSIKYGFPLQRVFTQTAHGLIGHRDSEAGKARGKWDPDTAFDWPRFVRECNETKARLLGTYTAESAVPNEAGGGETIGGGFADWLNRHAGERAVKITHDGYGDRLLFLASGTVLVWWKWTNQVQAVVRDV